MTEANRLETQKRAEVQVQGQALGETGRTDVAVKVKEFAGEFPLAPGRANLLFFSDLPLTG